MLANDQGAEATAPQLPEGPQSQYQAAAVLGADVSGMQQPTATSWQQLQHQQQQQLRLRVLLHSTADAVQAAQVAAEVLRAEAAAMGIDPDAQLWWDLQVIPSLRLMCCSACTSLRESFIASRPAQLPPAPHRSHQGLRVSMPRMFRSSLDTIFRRTAIAACRHHGCPHGSQAS